MPSGFNNVPPIPQQIGDNLLGGNLGGILSTRPQAKYSSGARTIVRINGKLVAFAFGITWRINTIFKEEETIDNIVPEELIPRRIKVDGTISALHIPGLGAGVQLWQADVLGFLFHQYISIEVRDSVTNDILFFAPRAAITTRQEEIRVDQLSNVTLSFIAIGFRDEKEPELPAGYDTVSKPATKAPSSPLGDFQSLNPNSAADLTRLV